MRFTEIPNFVDLKAAPDMILFQSSFIYRVSQDPVNLLHASHFLMATYHISIMFIDICIIIYIIYMFSISIGINHQPMSASGKCGLPAKPCPACPTLNCVHEASWRTWIKKFIDQTPLKLLQSWINDGWLIMD